MKRPPAPLLPSSICVACLLWLGGCTASIALPLVAGAGVPVFHRTLPDLVYSLASGRNCSLVRLDEGQTYCKPIDPPVAPIPYCTRSLAGVDCWAHPELIPGIPAQVAQGAHALTPEQDQARLARWPE